MLRSSLHISFSLLPNLGLLFSSLYVSCIQGFRFMPYFRMGPIQDYSYVFLAYVVVASVLF